MPWYHWIATFLHEAVLQLRATCRTNLALLSGAIMDQRTLVFGESDHPVQHVYTGEMTAQPTTLSPTPPDRRLFLSRSCSVCWLRRWEFTPSWCIPLRLWATS